MRRALRGCRETSKLLVRVAIRHVLVELVGTDRAEYRFPESLIVLTQSEQELASSWYAGYAGVASR